VGILHQIEQAFERVQVYKSGIGHLVQRCRAVIVAIDDPLEKVGRWGEVKIEGKVELLMRYAANFQLISDAIRFNF
jgi:hypothetical protein